MTAPGKGEAWYAYQKALDEEVEAARGSRSNLNDRLSEHLNPDGTPKAGSSIAKDWKASGDTPTYVSTTSFTVPTDKTAIYVKGLRLQLDLNASTVYNTVASSSFGAVTTITVETANLTADLQGVDYGIVSPGASGSLSGHRHSGEGDGGLYDYAADAEASDTYKVNLSPAPSAYYTGMLVHFKANTANTGAATLDVNSLGAKTIKKYYDQDLETGNIESGQIVTVIYDGTNFQMLSHLAKGAGLPKDFITGLILSNDAGDADHDINITAGEARDSTDAEDIVLSSEITKQIDAPWAVGDDAGGIDTGAVAADTIYAIWLIKRSDTGVVDTLFSTSFTAPTMPTNYDYKERIPGWMLTDGSSNIIPFEMNGDGRIRKYTYKNPPQIASGLNSVVYATQAVSGQFPTAAGIIISIDLVFTPAATLTFIVSYDGTNAIAGLYQASPNKETGMANITPNGNNIYYKVSGSNVALDAASAWVK